MKPNLMTQKKQGFTLIELLVVVGMLAIMAAFTYPSYDRYMMKGHRSEAQADLMSIAQLMQRHYSVKNTYANFTLAAELGVSPTNGKTERYAVTVTEQTATGFKLSAVPVKNDGCGTLTLTNTGIKGVGSDATKTASECW